MGRLDCKEPSLIALNGLARDANQFMTISDEQADQVLTVLKNAGIETGVHYKPIHQMSFYNSRTKLPETEKVANEIVSIPIHPNLTDDDVDYIIKSINKFC